jgi:sugar lactone lactonase YvrE
VEGRRRELPPPTGKHIGTIKTPEGLTNMNFGGVDGRTLFMTGYSNLYSIALKRAVGR